MSELIPFIRIGLYIAAGWLGSAGLPPDAVTIITTDPAIVDVLSQASAALVAGLTIIWWRIARLFGWAT